MEDTGVSEKFKECAMCEKVHRVPRLEQWASIIMMGRVLCKDENHLVFT